MDYLKRARELREETVANRRWLHRNAEVGLELPRTVAYVTEKLTEYGLSPQACGHGVTATVGRGDKCILLRADMDALPMPEESGLEFACPTGTEAHACGHDLHAAMLLTAAKMLKENEESLNGQVKFMFQPAEEIFQGARDMMAQGILEGVDAALGFHVNSGRAPAGYFAYNDSSTMMFSVDGFRITVQGKGAHGAYPHFSVDPIHIAVHVFLALEGLIARLADPSRANVLTVGKFQAGTANNIIPNEAVLEGTLRCDCPEERKKLVEALCRVAQDTAALWGGSARVEFVSQVPPLVCDGAVTKQMAGFLSELGLAGHNGASASASEDFAAVLEKVPGAFVYLTAGFADDRGSAPAHNPKVQFNEDVLPIGAAGFAHCAARWLEANE